MKRFTKTLVAAMIIAATGAAIMVGCKKEQDGKLADNGQIEQSDMSAEAAIARITDFKKQVDVRKAQPGMKSAETMSISDAVDDIVELFNAVYAQPENFYVQSVRNSFTINLPLTSEGKVLVDNVVSAYNQAIVMARQAYINDGISDNKGYVGLIAQLGNITDTTAELVFFSTSGQSGDYSTPPQNPNGPFGVDDDWKYMKPLGKCEGLSVASGADEQIELMIKSLCYDWGRDPVTGQRYYYYDYQHRDFYGHEHPDTLYFNPNIDDPCIEDDQMNSLFYSEMGFVKYSGPAQTGLPVTGSNRYYLRNFTIQGYFNPTNNGFFEHNISADYARRTLNWPIVVEPGDLLDD